MGKYQNGVFSLIYISNYVFNFSACCRRFIAVAL